MDVFRLTRLATGLLADGHPRLIYLPGWRLLGVLSLFFAVGTGLLTLTFSLWAIVAIPVLVYWSYIYVLFGHVWTRYCLSRVYLVVTPFAALTLSILLRYVWFRL